MKNTKSKEPDRLAVAGKCRRVLMSEQTQIVNIKESRYSDKVVKTGTLNSIKINAEDILQYLRGTGFNENMSVGVSEFCPYGEARRLDLFYFNRWNRETRGYEIKVSRADFLADKKWREYLKYCSKFYFVAPQGIIRPDELPPEIGLIEISVNEYPKSTFRAVDGEEDEKEYHLEHKFTKKCKRLPPISDEAYIQLLEGLLIKLVYKKNIQL